MKILPLLLTLLAGASAASGSVPELRGLYVENDKALFVLVDPDTGTSSRWLALGAEFEGYTLQDFQSAADTIVLTREGRTYPVKLRPTKVKYAATTLSGTIEYGAGHTVHVQRATLVFNEETTFPVAENLTLTLKPVLQPDGTVKYFSHFEETDPGGKKQVLSSPVVIARPGDTFSISMGDLGFSFKP